MTRPCRHYLGLYPDNRPSCAKGRNVREWAARCNGSTNGIALRLPCSDDREKPLFQCPELDRKTDEEIAHEREAMRRSLNPIIVAMPKLNELRKKMVERKLQSAKANCPWCEAKDALRLSCNIKGNKHLHVKCIECEEGFIE